MIPLMEDPGGGGGVHGDPSGPMDYYVYGDVTTLGSRPSRSHRVLTAFQVRSPNIGVCFEHAQNKRRDSAIIGDHGDHSTMSGVSTTFSTTFIPRLWRPWRALGPFSVAVDAQ